MDHNEAMESMATERYLLREMSAEQQDAFEEHFFQCAECALDVRVAAALIDHAKVELPLMADDTFAVTPKVTSKRGGWSSWLQPAWAVPSLAALLIVIAYQNLATIPSLRSAVSRPRLAPWSTMHVGTRAGAHTTVVADSKAGAVVLIDDLPTDGSYSSFAFNLEDPQGKQLWSETVKAPPGGHAAFSLSFPASGLQQPVYTLTIAGTTPQGNRTELDRRMLDVQFNH